MNKHNKHGLGKKTGMKVVEDIMRPGTRTPKHAQARAGPAYAYPC